MDEPTFRSFLQTSLARMLGAEVAAGPPETVDATSDPAVFGTGYGSLLVKPYKAAKFRLALKRSHPFEQTEKQLAKHFALQLDGLTGLEQKSFYPELLDTLPRRTIAAHLGASPTVLQLIERLEAWSGQTYEGRRITACFGIDAKAGAGEDLAAIIGEPFAPIITNGIDCLLVLGNNGKVLAYEDLPNPTAPSPSAPYWLRHIAAWTQVTADRIAFTLNRHGEILVIRSGQLVFARRGGEWAHFVHDANVKSMPAPHRKALREAIYASCLDVSFSRTGACLGVLAKQSAIPTCLDARDDLAKGTTPKSRLLRSMLGQPFGSLDRRRRMQALALDGAMILDYSGRIVAAGAILNSIASNAGGGGRLAAARELSKHGVSLKVSSDGPITCFQNQNLVFRV